MPNFCPECGNKITDNPKFCPKCGNKLMFGNETKEKIETQPKEGEIKCPFCSKYFKPPTSWTGEINAQKTTSTSGNIVRGAIFLPWGVVSAVKNKKFILCPYCKMKIMQG